MASTPPEAQEFWLELIEQYRFFPSLWKIKSDEYKNRNLKADCYKNMVIKMKEHKPNASKEMVTKKINALPCILDFGEKYKYQNLGLQRIHQLLESEVYLITFHLLV